MPARPRRRLLASGVLAALTAGALTFPAPAAATQAEPLPDAAGTSLRALVASGDSALPALPRGELRRAARASSASLRTTGTTSDSTGPAARGSLTTAPVSVINVTYRQDGVAWTDEAKAAFESAVQIWERTIESPVPIEVLATARTFDGDPSLLGGAGPYDFRRNNQGTETLTDDVFEPVALANARQSRDVLPGEPDVVAEFNPSLGGLYFGTDGNPPADRIDFKTVVLHEIGHGLGMVGTATVASDGTATVGDASVNGAAGVRSGVSYDAFTYATTQAQAGNGGTPILDLPDGSEELRTALTGGQLYWSGQLARTAAGGGRVRLYAPDAFYEGTSYGHLDETTYSGEHPNGLMTPFLEPGESLSDIGQIAMGMLADMGFAVPALRGARYTAVEPVRLLDTREGIGGAPGAVVPAGGVVDLRVTGANGVPADATAVVLNVTGVDPTAATDIRVYPTPVVAAPVPAVSNLNLAPGVTRANLVTVPIGNNGRVRLRNAAGSVSLLADLAGYYAPAAAATFTAADPVRILDTRTALGADRATPLGSGEVLDLAVSGDSSPVPPDASAVVLTVTAVHATATTDVRVYPTPTDEAAATPRVSSINLRPRAVVPNVVVVKVGPQGTVRLRNAAGTVHLVADVSGWYDGSLSGALFRPVTPSRILDTRTRVGTSPTAPTTVGPGTSLPLRVGGRAQVPSLATAAVLNVTGVSASTLTDIRVYPGDATSVPTVSNLNLDRGQTAADLVVVKLGGRLVQLRNSQGSVALVADVAGWFGPRT